MSIAKEASYDLQDKQKKEKEELHERQIKRLAVFEKHRGILELSMRVDKVKQMRWRRHFYVYAKMLSTKVFTSVDEEYVLVGKINRLEYNDTSMLLKACTKNDPLRMIHVDILHEFGCYDY